MRPRTTALVLSCIVLMVFVPLTRAQWVVPGPLIMDGVSPSSRQVAGLQAPTTGDQAISVGDMRAQFATRGIIVLNGPVWEVSIGALNGTIMPGTVLSFAIPEAPTPSTQLSVNGEAPIALSGWKGAPLVGSDLRPGQELRVVRGMDRYVVLDAVRRSCPDGYLAYAPSSCIKPTPRTTATFFQAADSCARQGARLCTMGEWVSACSLVPGFMDQVVQAEWVDHAANNADRTKVIGIGENGYSGAGTGCDYGGHRLPTALMPYRCCTER